MAHLNYQGLVPVSNDIIESLSLIRIKWFQQWHILMNENVSTSVDSYFRSYTNELLRKYVSTMSLQYRYCFQAVEVISQTFRKQNLIIISFAA